MFHERAEVIRFHLCINSGLFELFLHNQSCIVHFRIILCCYKYNLFIIISCLFQKLFCFFRIMLIVVLASGICSPLHIRRITPACTQFIEIWIAVRGKHNVITVQCRKRSLPECLVGHHALCCIQEQVKCTATVYIQRQSTIVSQILIIVNRDLLSNIILSTLNTGNSCGSICHNIIVDRLCCCFFLACKSACFTFGRLIIFKSFQLYILILFPLCHLVRACTDILTDSFCCRRLHSFLRIDRCRLNRAGKNHNNIGRRLVHL